MDVSILSVYWHEGKQPVYSVDFQPSTSGTSETSKRLATGGGDNNVRIWRLVEVVKDNGEDETSVEYLSTLAKHTQAVNAVRFNPNGELLATAGDDGSVMVWQRSDTLIKEFGQEDDDRQESWTTTLVCRSNNSEIYDIAWSPDSKYILTGSTDNVSRIFDAKTGQQVTQLSDHSHYVQGVAWDPLNKYIALQSADRSVSIYELKDSKDSRPLTPCLVQKSSRAEIGTRARETSTQLGSSPLKSSTGISSPASQAPPQRTTLLYHPEGLRSFFRRLTFSPDGSFLLTPAGISKTFDSDEEYLNTVYFYTRKGLNKPPIAHLPGMKKPALIVSFSPIFYKLDESEKENCSLHLPYKMVFAVATVDSIYIFDTQHLEMLGSVSSIHYSTLTDLTWNADGQSLIVSSTDGFCTKLKFNTGIFGEVLTVPFQSLISGDYTHCANSTKKRTSPKNTESCKRSRIEDTPTKPVKQAESNLLDTSAPPFIIGMLKKTTKEEQKADKNEQVIHTPPVKQKKRVAPTLITPSNTSK